jgi:CBS domain-containing protein
MAKRVISVLPHHTVVHVRGIMERNRIHAIPVVGPQMEAVGIVSSVDLARRLKDGTPIRRVMSRNVKTIPAYNDVSAAARAMRRSKIHHLVVTHEKQVVGMISSFDLMKLVEDHRFVMKNAPTKTAKKGRR